MPLGLKNTQKRWEERVVSSNSGLFHVSWWLQKLWRRLILWDPFWVKRYRRANSPPLRTPSFSQFPRSNFVLFKNVQRTYIYFFFKKVHSFGLTNWKCISVFYLLRISFQNKVKIHIVCFFYKNIPPDPKVLMEAVGVKISEGNHLIGILQLSSIFKSQ